MAMSKLALLDHRVSNLETEIKRLKERVQSPQVAKADWLDDLWGAFANDPLFDEAMELGRKYRESLRPKTGRTKPRKSRTNSGAGQRSVVRKKT